MPNHRTQRWWQEVGVEMLLFAISNEGSGRLSEKHTGEVAGVIARHDEILWEQSEGLVDWTRKHTVCGIIAAFGGVFPNQPHVSFH